MAVGTLMQSGTIKRRRATGADWCSVIKLPISLMNAAAAGAGYVILRPVIDLAAVTVTVSVFLLASGASALNSYQDRDVDRRYGRTCRRPLPRALIIPSQVRAAALSLIVMGVLGLLCLHSRWPALLGLAAVILYNGVYTPLKSRTALAVIPGALCGMMPPLIGWVAAGGSHCLLTIMVVMAMLGLWQLPHFWLLVLANRRDYDGGVLPHMLDFFSQRQLEGIIFVWIASFVCMTLLFPVVQGSTNLVTAVSLAVHFVILLALVAGAFCSHWRDRASPLLFRVLNLSMAVVLIVIIADSLFT